MDEEVNAVETGAEETANTDSATVEQTPQEDLDTPEKAQTTQDGNEDSSLEDESKSVPYERFKEVNEQAKRAKELEAELTQLRAKAEVLDRLQKAVNPEAPQDPTIERANKQLQEMGYVRKEDVDKLVEERIQASRVEDAFMNQVSSLEKKYDGKDGLPKFDPVEVAKFMDENPYFKDANGYPDVEKTFRAMHFDAFTDGAAKQKRGTAYSEKPGKPMASSETTGKADFEEAQKTGDWTQYLMGRVGSPFRGDNN